MAVVKSTNLTTLAAGTTLNKHYKGEVKNVADYYTSSGALADNTVVLFFEIPVMARISSIKMSSTDHGSTGLANVGFYPGSNSGTTISSDSNAVDEDAIGTAIDINAAAFTGTEIRFETKAITTLGQRAYELAGLSNRPAYSTFYVAVTLSEATTAAGTIALEISYID